MWCFAKMPAGSMIARRRRMWRSSTAWRSRSYAGIPAKALSKSSANAPAGICPTSPNSLVSTALEARFPRGRDVRAALRRAGFSTRLIERKGDRVIVETEAEGREHLLHFEHKMAQAGFTLAGKGFQ